MLATFGEPYWMGFSSPQASFLVRTRGEKRTKETKKETVGESSEGMTRREGTEGKRSEGEEVEGSLSSEQMIHSAPNVQYSLVPVRSLCRRRRLRRKVRQGRRGEEEGVGCAGQVEEAVLEVG